MSLHFYTEDRTGNQRLQDKSKTAYLSAKGFGGDGTCEHTGQRGENSDYVVYEYKVETGILTAKATTRAADDSFNRGEWKSEPMTAPDAIRLAHFMDGTLTAALKHQNSDAVSLNDLKSPEGRRLDDKKLEQMLQLAATTANSIMEGQAPGDRFLALVSPHVETQNVSYKDVDKTPDRRHLEGTIKLTAGDKVGYLDKKRLGLWIDAENPDDSRWIQPENDDAKSIKQFMATAVKSLGLSKALGAAVAADFGASDVAQAFKDRFIEDPTRTANILLGSSAPALKQVPVAPAHRPFGR